MKRIFSARSIKYTGIPEAEKKILWNIRLKNLRVRSADDFVKVYTAIGGVVEKEEFDLFIFWAAGTGEEDIENLQVHLIFFFFGQSAGGRCVIDRENAGLV